MWEFRSLRRICCSCSLLFKFISFSIMPSQSILEHENASSLSSILSMRLLNIGLIIEQDFLMLCKQCHTSVPFLVLITKLFFCSLVPRDTTSDTKVTCSSSKDILYIEDNTREKRLIERKNFREILLQRWISIL